MQKRTPNTQGPSESNDSYRPGHLRSSVAPQTGTSWLGSRANTLRFSSIFQGGSSTLGFHSSSALDSRIADLRHNAGILRSPAQLSGSFLRSSAAPEPSGGSHIVPGRQPMNLPANSLSSRLNSLRSSATVQSSSSSGSSRVNSLAAQIGQSSIYSAGFETQQCVDVVFLCDVTGSMQYIIDAVYNKLEEIVDAVIDKFPGVLFRTAFVGYRDTTDGNGRLVIQDFQDDPAEMKRFIHTVRAWGGGGDGPEDVFGGLAAIPELAWRSKARIMLHIADMPCHGERFHGGRCRKDNHPDGDPNGHTAEDLLRCIFEKRIQYYFLKLTNETDMMIKIFNEIAMQYDRHIETKSLQSPVHDFVPTVVESISTSMRSSGFK
ncbi:hypothetical protein BC936DRAFT_141976 [Jimgerdemannia flammicorona]|uniref:Uncharacterized protein n=2 Tax=Jimgerdemannia flammicorona TaxID=994334 RepID=A0A433P8Y1_9FUNG|nr:hypothetical protein BC936DRAFT_141976 [Jimgerdemannia flammicorona]RUS13996.1 hypothetical protein BC938DRAFT_477581 [Jimgerdemannia flammicorona]